MATGHNPPPAGGTVAVAAHSLSRIGFGAMQLRRLRDDRDAAVRLLRLAVELGVNHVDTAQFYGDGFVNEIIREAYRNADRPVIISKVGGDPDPTGRTPLRLAQRPGQLRASVEANLKSLGLDYLPVINLRRADTHPALREQPDQVIDIEDQLATLTALRDDGKIGAIGLSAVTVDLVHRALPARIACVQNAYSLAMRNDEDLLALCAKEGIAWMPFFPLGGAQPGMAKVTDLPEVLAVADRLGVSPSQVGLAWLLHHAPNIALIPGTSNPHHLRANIAAGSVHLDNALMRSLDHAGVHPDAHSPTESLTDVRQPRK
ncbi:aldo/keto reductase [Streptomyces sp. NPDC007851]|uniref:aldo/keto reductase n=1 Tax=Streptomyces sp. NPDC007851 TaxID=3155008 RepID=UPI0033C9B587